MILGTRPTCLCKKKHFFFFFFQQRMALGLSAPSGWPSEPSLPAVPCPVSSQHRPQPYWGYWDARGCARGRCLRAGVVSAAQCTCLLPYLSSSASSLKDGKNIPVPAEGMEAGVESSVPPQGSRSVAVSCLGEALPAPGPDLLSQLRLNFTISFSFFPQKAAQQHAILKLVHWDGD